MRAFDRAAIPAFPQAHPLGRHRTPAADRVCFGGILVRLVTGCSWVDVEYLPGGRVLWSATARRT
jgi:hypothetical protein